jgi:hypothetical protein
MEVQQNLWECNLFPTFHWSKILPAGSCAGAIYNPQSTIVNHQSPIVNRQSSIINRQSTIVNHQSPIVNLQSLSVPIAAYFGEW